MNNKDSNQKAKVSCILDGCLISKYTGTESDVRTVVIYLSCKNTDLEKNEAKPKCFGTYLKASTRQTLIKQNLKSQSYFKGTGKEQAWCLIFSRWSQRDSRLGAALNNSHQRHGVIVWPPEEVGGGLGGIGFSRASTPFTKRQIKQPLSFPSNV